MHEIKLIVKQILCIKLVKYCDKYTEMHGQQNVKKIFPLSFPRQTLYAFLILVTNITRPAHLILLDMTTQMYGDDQETLRFSLWNLARLLLLPFSRAQVFPSAARSKTTSTYVLPLI